MYLINVFKNMYFNTFLNTLLHSPININNRSKVCYLSEPFAGNKIITYAYQLYSSLTY